MIPFKYGGGPKIKLLSSLMAPPRVTLGLQGLVESSTPRTTLEKTASVGGLVLVQTTRQNFLDSQNPAKLSVIEALKNVKHSEIQKFSSKRSTRRTSSTTPSSTSL